MHTDAEHISGHGTHTYPQTNTAHIYIPPLHNADTNTVLDTHTNTEHGYTVRIYILHAYARQTYIQGHGTHTYTHINTTHIYTQTLNMGIPTLTLHFTHTLTLNIGIPTLDMVTH